MRIITYIVAAVLMLGSRQIWAEECKDGCGDKGVPATAEDIFQAECEHKIPQYTCDECRYELGLVKISSQLFKEKGGPLATGRMERVEMAQHFEASGEIHLGLNMEVHVSPRISGVISRVYSDIGSRVKKGEVLFEIESTELGEAIGMYRKNILLEELTRRNHEREKKLNEQKIVSEVDMINAQMEHEKIKADLEAAEHKLHVMGLSEEEVSGIKTNSHSQATGKLPYRASMDGIVIEKHASVGELAQPGKDVMLIGDLSRVSAWLDIYEMDIARVIDAGKAGPVNVEIETKAFPAALFKGQLDYIGAVMNEQSRTIRVRAMLDNPDEKLRPGMFCTARVETGARDKVPAVKRGAVMSDEGSAFVFRRVRDDFFLRTSVVTGRENGEMLEIKDGLGVDDVIITEGAFVLKSDVLREKMGAGCAD